MTNERVPLSIEADSETIDAFLGGSSPALGSIVVLPGRARVRNLSAGAHGVDFMEAAKFLLLNANAVATSVFASYIYEKLKDRQATLRIAGKAVPIDAPAIKSALEDHREGPIDVEQDRTG